MGRPRSTPRGDNGDSGWNPDTFVGRLPATDRQILLALGGSAFHPEGEHLMVEGDRSRFVLVLHDGPVKVVVHDTSGREHLLALRGRGDLLGELAYLDHQPRSASVVTLRQTYATTIGAERFSRFLDEHPRAGVELARCIGARLRAADWSRLEISTDAVPLRVARVLRKLAQESVAGSPRHRAVISITQGQLAQSVHAAEVTINRILRELKAQGLIDTAYASIEVPCIDCLDLLLAALCTEQKEGGKDIRGCGGRGPHCSR